jgi:hypothetical protein
MMVLKRLHFFFGLFIVTHFVITGLLMRWNFFSIGSEDTTVRMMFRANHIYILFSGLVHLLISHSLRNNANAFHLIASGVLVLATIGISASFYIDPIKHIDLSPGLIQRKLTGYSVIGCLVGTALHLLLLQLLHRKYEGPHPLIVAAWLGWPVKIRFSFFNLVEPTEGYCFGAQTPPS